MRTALDLGKRNQRSRPSGSLLVEFGVSLNAGGYYPASYTPGSPPAVRAYLVNGPIHWARRRLKNAFTILGHFGIDGDTSVGGLARINEVVSAVPKPDWCLVQFGSDPSLVTAGDFAGSEATYLAFVGAMTKILQKLEDHDIKPILATLPLNALWQDNARYSLASRMRWWTQDYARKHHYPLIDAFSVFNRPTRELFKDPTALSRTTNVVTATIVGHAYATGDWIAQGTAAIDAGFVFTTTKQITVTGTDTFTYAHTGSDGSATNKGNLVRGGSISDRTTDGTHYNAKGASIISFVYEAVLEPLFPKYDALADTEGDYTNLIAAGTAGATNLVANRGMMTGTTGTRTGTAVSHTGNVATGWTSDVMSGNPTSVVCAKVVRPELGYEGQEWQEVALTAAAGADCKHQINIAMTPPSAWVLSTAKSVSNWIKPVTQNGKWYVCTAAGTTGTTEPVWPTVLGQTIVDGTVTWECREGWKSGDRVVAQAEYRIQAMSAEDAINNLSFGLFDPSDDTRNICDFGHTGTNVPAPLYQSGENGYFCTPEAVIDAATTQFVVGMRTLITANRSATIRITRVTWRKVP